MKMMPFRVIPHTADLAIEAYGRDLKDLFENSARGMFYLIYEKTPLLQSDRKVFKTIKKKFKIKNEIPGDMEMLLNLFLSALLKFQSEKNLSLLSIEIQKIDSRKVIFSAEFLQESDQPLHEIKSVTFHNMKIEKQEDGTLKTMIVFDV